MLDTKIQSRKTFYIYKKHFTEHQRILKDFQSRREQMLATKCGVEAQSAGNYSGPSV